MASPPEEPPKLSLEEVKLCVETILEAKMTIDNFFERRKRAMEMGETEDVAHQVLTKSRVRTPESNGNQMHSSIVWTLPIPKMCFLSKAYYV